MAYWQLVHNRLFLIYKNGPRAARSGGDAPWTQQTATMRRDWENLDPRLLRLIGPLLPKIAALAGVEKLVLYGSYAKGTQTEGSDVDLAVFFSEANGSLLLEEYRSLAHICATPEIDMQVQAFSLAELDSPCGIIEEIARHGVELPLRRAPMSVHNAQGGRP